MVVGNAFAATFMRSADLRGWWLQAGTPQSKATVDLGTRKLAPVEIIYDVEPVFRMGLFPKRVKAVYAYSDLNELRVPPLLKRACLG